MSFYLNNQIIMKKIVLPLLLLIAATTRANAQNLLMYGYDALGNRIYRLTATLRSKKQTRAMTDSASLTNGNRIHALFDKNNTTAKVEIASWDNSMLCNVSVFDLTGKELVSEKIVSSVTSIDLSRLWKGTYILSVTINGEVWNRKFNR